MRFKTRKNKRQRGSKTHGWGSKKKHRGAGHRGGRGLAGTGKRGDAKKPTIIKTIGNSYYGQHGFTSHSRKVERIINLRQLSLMIENGKVGKEVNLGTLGYDKLLGMGKFEHKIKITVKRASAKVAEKLKKAGSELVLEENVPTE